MKCADTVRAVMRVGMLLSALNSGKN